MASIYDLLTPEATRKLGALALRSRFTVEGIRAGAHASPHKGASVEFADHRSYVKGDNLRGLDWKVFGRTERYFVKQYKEETSLRVYLVIDGSKSMSYKSAKAKWSKYDYACRLGAALGYIVSKQSDSLGLTIYDKEIRREIPARSGPRHLQVALDALLAHQPDQETHTGQALHALAESLSRRGLVVIMSDLFDDQDAIFRALAHFRKKMHDVILLQILDPVELDLSIDQVAEFTDLETGEKLEVDPVQTRLAYKQELQKFIDSTRERCSGMNVDYRLVSTGEGFEDFLHQYLAERALL
jgi:uncharacterized protein (DUF58 family)